MKIDLTKPYNELPIIPPKRELIENVAILRQETKAATALALLKGIAKTLPNQGILINAISLREAKSSSEIENILTTNDALFKALTVKSDKPDTATKEVLRYREALFEGFNYIEKHKHLNINGILLIEKILTENNEGIRTLPGTSIKNARTGKIIYTPPDDKNSLQKLLKNYEEFININEDDDISPLTKLAIQHYQFESIHPFYDGNGRAGRIINILFLILKGLLDIPILYLSGFIINNKSTYYGLLNEVTTKGNWEEWVIYILKGIEFTANETINKINDINESLDKTISIIKQKEPKIYTKELAELLYENPYCKIEFIENKGIAKRKTAGMYLSKLEALGLLEKKKIGSENIYVNKAFYEILKS